MVVPLVIAQELLEAFAVQVGVPAPSAEEFETLLEVAAKRVVARAEAG